MNIAIVGNGRMGRTLDAVCARRDDVRVIGHVGRGGCESLDALDGLDAALDFSAPENLPMLLSGAVRRRIPLVIGTTAVIVWVGITLLLAGITAFSLALQLRNAHHCLHSGR